MEKCKGLVAVVTGGGRGIGEAAAQRFAKEGAKVAVMDVNKENAQGTAAKIRERGGEALALGIDVSSRREVEGGMAEVVSTFGKIDILVNNAGVLKDNLISAMTDEDWDQVLDINLKGAFLCSQTAQKYMVERQYGKIVMLSSQAAVGGRQGRANYAASKAGIQGLTKSLAIELGPFGINVNAVAPGFIDTDMSKASIASAKQRGIADFEAYKRQLINSNPIRRAGTVDDVANVIFFLCSEEASYVTGQVIYVAGRPVV